MLVGLPPGTAVCVCAKGSESRRICAGSITASQPWEGEGEGRLLGGGEGGRQRSAENRSGGRASQPLPDARVLLSRELDNGL